LGPFNSRTRSVFRPYSYGRVITIVSIKEDGVVLTAGQPSPSTGLTYVIDDVPYIAET
jgi:hypothetical protein